jgi:pimeloyl-ACP methyl ester carboxylesterase
VAIPAAMTINPFYPFRSAETRDEYLAWEARSVALWPIPSETRTVETSYGPTFVRLGGPANAPPLVLLPGSATTGLSWRAMIEPLSKDYRTYAVDNICDLGRSALTRPMRSVADLGGWLDELFTGLGIEKVNLMGASYGAWMTAQMALLRPERLRRAVWVEPGAVVLKTKWSLFARASIGFLHPALLRRFFAFVLADSMKTPAGRKVVDQLVEGSFVAKRCFAPRPVKFSFFRKLLSKLTDEELRAIRVPTLYLVGEHETLYSAPEAMARLRAVAPQIETEMYPNAGHDLPLLHTEAITKRVLAFLGAEVVANHPPPPPPP